jgi:hypothetical protein
MHNHTNPILIDIMMAGLQSYFLNRPIDYSEFSASDAPNHTQPPYYTLIRHQESIGWDHFLRGKLSHHWTQLQQDFVWRTAPGTKFESEAWLRLIIRPILTDCLDLWTIGNNKRHGTNDKAKKCLGAAAQVEGNLQALYLM